MRRVIGFDPSYQSGNTGFAVIECGPRPVLVASGVLAQQGESESERFASLQKEVEAVCMMYGVQKGAVERPPSFAYKRSQSEEGKPLNISAIIKNSNAAAIILAALGRLGITAVTCDAHQWKKYGKTNLSKADMKALAERQFPQLKAKRLSSHEAEAVCIAVLNL